MSRTPVSLRLTRAQIAFLRRHAEAHGVSLYQSSTRAMEAGLAALAGASEPGAAEEPIAALIGELLARIERLERLADRALYSAAAAYSYARQAALAGARDAKVLDDAVAEAAGEAYRRQRDLARGGS
ncbi:hypothetical protein [Caulobacter sp. BP25]|uniref:hypothetical protein n=1 Tax=Caulobacter sp. BP25 TaxID=2048900 RepID=UPI000C12C991|nr:hypothetical protein [Caulobacter sp. BP25]PHY21504.1 hypothetical protein CSW59_04640 [Caulobacter sp. BP25]